MVSLWVLGIALATAGANEPDPLEKPPLVLLQGEQRRLVIEGLARFSVGSPEVRVLRLGSGLMIKGVQPGTSDLSVWASDGSYEHRLIQVEPLSPQTRGWLGPDLSRALTPLRETQVWIGAEGILLKGPISSLAESSRVGVLKRLFAKQVRDETELSPELRTQAGERLQRWLESAHLGDRVRLEERESRWVLTGSVSGPTALDRLAKGAKGAFPQVEIEVESLPDTSPTVHLKVMLLELRRTRARALGLSWPEGQEGAFHVGPTGFENRLALDVALRALESEGSVRVLSEPELVVRAPGEAELFSGGEMPIEQRTHFYSNVQWKAVGLSLKLKVNQATAHDTRLEVSTETSHVDPTLSSSETPGIRSNRMKTQIDATFGVPLLLSGLLQQEHRAAEKGWPALSHLPLLGALFGSEEESDFRTELVAILIPSLALPTKSVERAQAHGPSGPVPWPRDRYSLEEQKRLRASPDFPWNVLE